ncbi:unnamed protein product [Pylaiella littoralis]
MYEYFCNAYHGSCTCYYMCAPNGPMYVMTTAVWFYWNCRSDEHQIFPVSRRWGIYFRYRRVFPCCEVFVGLWVILTSLPPPYSNLARGHKPSTHRATILPGM